MITRIPVATIAPTFLLAAIVTLSACSGGTTTAEEPAMASGTYAVTDCQALAEPGSADAASGVAITPDISVVNDDVPVVYVREGSAPANELISVDIQPGTGDTVSLDDVITVEYCGVGLSTGALFDASWARGAPATFQLSQGQLIQGWVDGIPGMKVGERRVLVIPSELAYGQTPPPGIEPGETLIFVVELLDISN